jgi:hypothetical protein
MKTLSILALIGATSALLATGASAQTAPAPQAWTPPPGSFAHMPTSGYRSDVWSIMATTRADENVLKIVGKDGWSRARKAAVAINAGRCGDAAAIAARDNDERLMLGVKRACKAV